MSFICFVVFFWIDDAFTSVFIERKSLSDVDLQRLQIICDSMTRLVTETRISTDYSQFFQIVSGALRCLAPFHNGCDQLRQLAISTLVKDTDFQAQWALAFLNQSHVINPSCVAKHVQDLAPPTRINTIMKVRFGMRSSISIHYLLVVHNEKKIQDTFAIKTS